MRKSWERLGRGWVMLVALVAGPAGVFSCNAVLGVDEFQRAVCDAGERTCSSENAVLICSTWGQWLEPEPCSARNQTCSEGECTGSCAPAERRCAESTTQKCGTKGDWEDDTECSESETCVGGQCIRQCAVGDRRCLGNTPQICDAYGKWKGAESCSQSTCVLGKCEGVCEPSATRCEGNKPQTCNGGKWVEQPACTGALTCSDGLCTGPSCVGLGRICGPKGDESCCISLQVQGGKYNIINQNNFPADVDDFRLDRFEITVGRFRRFVDAYPGSKPAQGEGAHPQVKGSGWQADWDGLLPVNQAKLRAKLVECSPYATWSDVASSNESLPMNCITWYEAFAFCVWDRGRLPTEAEWNYAAAGGIEQRKYPWGSSELLDTHAVYDCRGDGISDCKMVDILSVGSKSPMGDGKFGHADLAGSTDEWNFDWFSDPLPHQFPDVCDNCAQLTAQLIEVGGGQTTMRVTRGGGWDMESPRLRTFARGHIEPAQRTDTSGARCARSE